jgi:adenylate cyclase
MDRPPAALEIERKFVVSSLPAGLDLHPFERIQQGYLAIADDGVEVRVRRRGTLRVLTVKSGPAKIRVEEELPLDERRFEALWRLTAERRLSKTRYRVPLGTLVAEVDVYDDALAGLVTVEVEFPTAAASTGFTPPAWFGREVTDDARYANQSLARFGLPSSF